MNHIDTTLPDSIYATTEFPLAVSLLYFSIPLLGLERDPRSPQKVSFVFEKSDACRQTLDGYWNDTLQCSPKKWHLLSRELKSRIKDELAREENRYDT